ncbi:hypothetical protein Ddye_028323 [Dipteronia dyeriana]|uniref:Reverse transcriptase zinc-binding domain-containing protein n=1 Tax=Dipteronia dyeriana TaxID=168575 RepID=A0AAD9TRA2_9ROSI|nr:hypothetical protein Ddye_028323 [Dipteronia dyeriana]
MIPPTEPLAFIPTPFINRDPPKFFHCSLDSLPLSYLGLSLGGNHTREILWHPIIAKVENRLAHWKRGFLSKGSRLVLIKAILSSLSTYFMRCLEESSAHESSVALFLWKGLCPPKVDIFLWQLLRGRTLVKEVIHRLGGGQLVDLICPLCGEGDESVDHLFLLYVCDKYVDKENFRVVKHNWWTPPMGNALFFNVDGSVKGRSGEAGIGGALREVTEQMLRLFSSYLGVKDSCSAEVHAILKACQLVSSSRSLLMRHISIITDSKSTVEWIKGEDFSHLLVAHLVYDIRNFLKLCSS